MNDPDSTNPAAVPRRDFLLVASTALAAGGVAAFSWPLIDQMNPDASVKASATIDVDVSPIEVGQAITVMWRGKPVFIRHRTSEEIAAAEQVNLETLVDRQEDSSRVQKPQWLVVIGVCTHLGCIPQGQRVGQPRGAYNGWYCSCHGSSYDTSGRIRGGPAPLNLSVPQYIFLSDTTIRLGASES